MSKIIIYSCPEKICHRHWVNIVFAHLAKEEPNIIPRIVLYAKRPLLRQSSKPFLYVNYGCREKLDLCLHVNIMQLRTMPPIAKR